MKSPLTRAFFSPLGKSGGRWYATSLAWKAAYRNHRVGCHPICQWKQSHPEKLDLSALHHALVSLEESIAIVSRADWFAQQPAALQNTVIAGVIQNFEFVYELGIKMIRRQLELEAASPSEVDESSFRALMRAAGEKGLIADVEAWFGYRRMRNITARTYDHAKARQVYDGSLIFVNDARALLMALESRHA